MAGCFISTYKGEWKVPANVLKEQLGYEIIELIWKVFSFYIEQVGPAQERD